jgi:acyl dehydratase
MAIDRSAIGRELATVEVSIDADAIRRFAAAIEESDPVFHELEAARAQGYRSLPAPPTYLFCLKSFVAFPGDILKTLGVDTDTMTLLHAEQTFSYHAPACAGDRITFRERIADIYEKKGGALVFVVTQTVATNQTGTKVAEIGYTEAVQARS